MSETTVLFQDSAQAEKRRLASANASGHVALGVTLYNASGAAIGDGAALVAALSADAKTGALKSIEITLSATPGTVTAVTIPDTAQGIRLFPRSNGIRFAVGEDPAAVGTSTSTTIAADALTVGGIAKADAWETRILAAGTSRTVRLRSITASVVVDMEVF